MPFYTSDDDGDVDKPVDGATVVLQGPAETYRTTSVGGHYEFTGLRRGTYRVSVMMPDGLPPARSARPAERLVEPGELLFEDAHDYARSVTIADARSCGYAPFAAAFDGQIAGSIVHADGSPAKGMEVEISPNTIDPRRQWFSGPTASTDESGAYRLEGLPPGRYVVGINLRDALGPFPATLYRQPGDDRPSIIELGADAQAELGVLRLPPPQAKRQLAGVVRWSDGRPVGKLSVTVSEAQSDKLTSASQVLDVRSDGAFSTQMYEGRSYVVTAEAADPRGWRDSATDQVIPPIASATVTIRLDGDRMNLQLVLVPGSRRP